MSISLIDAAGPRLTDRWVYPEQGGAGPTGLDHSTDPRRREAIEAACGIRLRPILMTTAAMVLGVTPLIVASGAGAVSRFDMGLVIASGISIGTLFTLFVVPAVYMLIAEDHHATREAEAAESAAAPPIPRAP